MDVKKVLYISQEIDPYIPATPLSTACREFAQGLQEKGAEVRSFMPKYGAINERRNQLHEVIRLSGLNIIIDDCDHPLIIKVATLQPTRLQVYFIDNDDYFYRHAPGKLETRDWTENNDERSIFFVRGTIETVRKLRWEADIVQCAGWISALTPLYIKKSYSEDPAFRNAKTVYSLTADAFDGTLDPRLPEKLIADGIDPEALKPYTADGAPIDWLKLNKIAIDNADAIMEFTPGVPDELIEYAKASGKPFLPYSDGSDDGDKATRYHRFYTAL